MSQMIAQSEEILSYASKLQAQAQQIQQVFSGVRAHMQQASAIWKSPAASALNARFESLVPYFDQYVSQVEGFSIYLRDTAALYSENEQALSALSAK